MTINLNLHEALTLYSLLQNQYDKCKDLDKDNYPNILEDSALMYKLAKLTSPYWNK